jgi:hypothetical protein
MGSLSSEMWCTSVFLITNCLLLFLPTPVFYYYVFFCKCREKYIQLFSMKFPFSFLLNGWNKSYTSVRPNTNGCLHITICVIIQEDFYVDLCQLPQKFVCRRSKVPSSARMNMIFYSCFTFGHVVSVFWLNSYFFCLGHSHKYHHAVVCNMYQIVKFSLLRIQKCSAFQDCAY